MKRWTQAEFEAMRGGLDGCRHLPAGDWSGVDLRGQNRLIFAPHSILGDYAGIGALCELGDHCEVGEKFSAGGGLIVGACCRFGKNAFIGSGARIGRSVSFGEGACLPNEDLELGDGLDVAGECRLFGVRGVLGSSITKIYMTGKATLYAFQKKSGEAFVSVESRTLTLEEFEERAVEDACMHGMTQTPQEIHRAREMMAAAKYLRTLFGLRQMQAEMNV